MTKQINIIANADRAGLAAYVKLQRGHLRWKRDLLASMAGVSLSTVERVERGEVVRPAALEAIAGALGLEHDAFTRPRPQLDEGEQREWLERMRGWMESRVPVSVAPLRNEVQLRSLSGTQLVVFDSDLGTSAADDLGELREWLDLAGFIRSTIAGFVSPPPDRGFRMRPFYADIFEHVRVMERRHDAVCLVGSYVAETDMPRMREVEVGVLALRSRKANPAAIKIDMLFAERRIHRGSIAWNS